VTENWDNGDQVNFNLAAQDSCSGATQYYTGTDTVQSGIIVAADVVQVGYALWMDGVKALSDEEFMRPIGPAEGPFAEEPMAALIVHINREALHHGAEIALLRDLYRWKDKE
jgi:hypothetical protein